MAMNPYTPEAAQQKYPGAPPRQARAPWRASGASQPRPQQNTGGQQEAAPGPQKAPDMSRYASPGQAQPIQPQSQGTPYGAQPDGNYAYATPQNRPAPFTQRFTNFDGAQSEQPDFGRRDAFIQNINDSMLPYYGGKSQGAPQFDFQNMWGKAGDMVSNGWQNPFAMPAQPQQPSLEQQLSQYAPQTQYQPARQQIYAPLPVSPEQQAEYESRRAWEAAGSPGYSAEQQPMSWHDMHQQLGTWVNGSFGANVSETPEYKRYGDIERRNMDASDRAFAEWRKANAPSQPTSMPADPYAQFRPDDSGFMYPNPAGPPAFDPLYGRGTTEAWEAAGAPKSAPRPGAAPREILFGPNGRIGPAY